MREMKDSGIEWIGDIPAHWKTCKYKYFTENGMGETILKEDLKSNGIPVYSATQEDVCFGFIDNPRVILHKGDFIIPARGNSIGCVSFVKDEIATCTQTTIYSKLTGRPIVNKYLFYCALGLKDIWFKFDQTAIPQITVAQVENNIVPLPISESEQQAIADYLDGECARIDGIVTTQRQIIERLKEYKKSVITEAVTRGLNPDTPMKDSGIEWIGKIPEHWEISKVSFFFDIQLGKMVQPNKENEFDIERPYLCAVNFGNNTFKLDTIKTMWFSPAEIELYRVSVGDLFVVEGGDIASSDFVTHPLEDFGFQNALHRVRARASADTRFLRYLLIVAKNTGYIDLICNKATIAHFSKDKFQNMPFLVAPLSEQQAIADYLDKKSAEVDTIIEKRERMIELMTEYKKSLIYECVTGKKEIVDVVE